MNPYINLLLLPLIFGNVVIAQQKPNILWVTIEDTSPQFIGCYGNKDARLRLSTGWQRKVLMAMK